MKKNPQIKYVLIANIFFFASLATFWYLYHRVSINRAEALELERKWQEQSTEQYDLNSLARTIKNLEPELAELDSHFVHADNVVTFLSYLENLGSPVAVKAEINSVDRSTEGAGDVLTLGINISGNFSGIYKYITLLENAKYEIEILSFEIKQQGGQASNPNWGASLRIKLHSFIP